MNKCGDCIFYKGEPYHKSGDCFRYPPVVASEGEHLDIITVTVRPNVEKDESACGEFKQDKAKAAYDSAEFDGTNNI